jgi:hypothetical protein
MNEIEAYSGQQFERLPRKLRSEHFQWAVRFQVNGELVTRIAESLENPEVRTVNLAISKVLQLAGLTRRRDKPGPSLGSS